MGKHKSLIDALNNPEPPPSRGYPCGVHRVFERLDDNEKAVLQQRIEELRHQRQAVGAKAETTFTAKWLAEVLTKNGHSVSALVMQTHIRKSCSCGY